MTRYDRLRLLGSIPFGIVTGAASGAVIGALVTITEIGPAGVDPFAPDYNGSLAYVVIAALWGALIGFFLGPISFSVWLGNAGLFRSMPLVFAATVISGWFCFCAGFALSELFPENVGIGIVLGALMVFGGLIGFFGSCHWIARRGRVMP